MRIADELEQLCSICINHFEELDKDHAGKIKVFSIELDSRGIWGGNGDRYEDRTYYISKAGWLARDQVQETGLYQKGDGMISDRFEEVTPQKIESDINGSQATILAIEALLKFYNEIHGKYPREFKIFA